MDAPGSGPGGRRPDLLLGLAHLTGSRRRLFGALAFVLLGASLLSSCGSKAVDTTAARLLTNADVGPPLGLTENRSSTTVNLGKALSQTYPGCVAHFTAFTERGRTPSPVATGTTIFPEVFSEASACTSVAQATAVFARAARQVEVKKVGGKALAGMADAAVMARIETGRAHEYALFWRNGPVLGFIQLSGPADNPAISADQIKVLGRRQIARQSGRGS
ncbi:MAG TPA: hypothetical protein VIJ09_14920 [Acidimicrobiales bacterium]